MFTDFLKSASEGYLDKKKKNKNIAFLNKELLFSRCVQVQNFSQQL